MQCHIHKIVEYFIINGKSIQSGKTVLLMNINKSTRFG